MPRTGKLARARPPPPNAVLATARGARAFMQECPPLETVLTLLDPGKPLMWKVFKPVSEVERAEVLSGLRDVLAGNTAPQHATASALQRPEQH